MTDTQIKSTDEQLTLPIIKRLSEKWLNGFTVPAQVSNEQFKHHEISAQGSYRIVTERVTQQSAGIHSHDCDSENHCISRIEKYEAAVKSGAIEAVLYKSVELIKTDPVGSFSLYKMVDSREHSFIETCNNCNGRGQETCYGCHGSGETSCYNCSNGYRTCDSCSNGYVHNTDGSKDRCYSCSGSGEKRCYSCNGNGRITCSTCSGRRTLDCNPCAATGYFTITLTCYARLSGQQECAWQSDSAYAWLDSYLKQAIAKNIPHAQLNETVNWNLSTFNFTCDNRFPLQTAMDGTLKTTTADIDIDSTGAVNGQFIGEIHKPFDLNACFDKYLDKHCQTLQDKFEPKHCKTVFATNIAKNTFELVKTDELPDNIAYQANLFSPTMGSKLKQTLLNVGTQFDNSRKKVAIPRVMLSMVLHFIVLFAAVVSVDTALKYQIDWQAFKSANFGLSLLINLGHAFELLLRHRPQDLLAVFALSFIPMLMLRSWLGSHQIWQARKLFVWYIIATPLLFTLATSFVSQELIFSLEPVTFSQAALMNSIERCLAVLFDLVMLAGLIAILRTRKLAYSKNRKIAKQVESSALNRLLNYE